MNSSPAIASIASIVSAIIGLAILSVLVSPKAKTVGVINAAGKFLQGSIATAVSPVTGAGVGSPF